MSISAQRLERLRHLAASEGIPLDCVDALLLHPNRVARLVAVDRKTILRELEDGELATTWIRGARRVAVLDLLEYLDRRRSLGRRRPSSSASASSRARAFLEEVAGG